MRSSEFRRYVLLFTLPLFFFAGILLYKPSFLSLLSPEIQILEILKIAAGIQENQSPPRMQNPWGTEEQYAVSLSVPVRIIGFSFLFYSLVLLNIRSSPSQNRELFFWMSLYMLSIAALLGAAPFFRLMNGAAALLALYFFFFFLFLFGFASRNMIVRE